MVKVKLTSPAGMRHEGIRYCKDDIFVVSDYFYNTHATRFEVIKPEPKKRKYKKQVVEEAPIEVTSDGDYTRDNK